MVPVRLVYRAGKASREVFSFVENFATLLFYTGSLTTTLDYRCALPLLLCAGYDKLQDKWHSNVTQPRSLKDFTALSPHLSTQGRQQGSNEGPTQWRKEFQVLFYFFSLL